MDPMIIFGVTVVIFLLSCSMLVAFLVSQKRMNRERQRLEAARAERDRPRGS